MLPPLTLDSGADTPLYKQLYEQLRGHIRSGRLSRGERLPATRELAGLLGLNRATVAAAYELLESEGLLKGHVGRGSFVDTGVASDNPSPGALNTQGRIAWDQASAHSIASAPAAPPLNTLPAPAISFASSRPAAELFPMEAFRLTAREVIEHPDAAAILQLGSPSGYEPLRRWLLANHGQSASDDVLVTSGCQQALDLIARVLIQPGDTVALEDPVYPGLQAVFVAAGARLTGIPTNGNSGISIEALETTLLRDRPKLLVVTPDFQNPTGGSIPLAERKRILALAREHGVILVENAIYNGLRYTGTPLPGLKALDETGDVILIDSFSKLAFPGLRVGWIVANESLIARLTHAKQWCDLHSDQLSQAILYRFALTGRLDTHIAGVCRHGGLRLRAAIEACRELLPEGTRSTEPEGGMSLWVSLPDPLDAGELLAKAERAGVNYLPGRFFAVNNRIDPGGFRLCFAGLPPERIREGVAILGEVFGAEQARLRAARRLDPLPALV